MVAASVLSRHQVESLPICPLIIAEREDILVEPKDCVEPGVSGFLMRVGESFGIQYATHIKNERFIRFTIAHELGHFFLPGHPQHLFPTGDGIHRSRSGFISSDPHERQADHFAAALLMPDGPFRDAMQDVGEGFDAIQTVATLCETSITSTAIRYTQFAEDLIAVIVSSNGKIDYSFLSEPMKRLRNTEFFQKGSLVPPSTVSASFNRDQNKVSRGQQDAGWTWLDDWFDGAPRWAMKEDVVGLGSYGKTLTVLFNSDAVLDDEEDEEDR